LKALLFSVLLSLPVFADQQDPSSKVEVSVHPDTPIVLTADFHNGFKYVKGPWFMAQIHLLNGSSDEITIIAARAHVETKNPAGQSFSRDLTITPSDFNYTLECGNSQQFDVKYDDFGEFPIGLGEYLSATYRRGVPVACNAIPRMTPIKFYFDKLPTWKGQNDYVYSVRLTLIGWFGSRNNPTTRFEKTVEFQSR
jgi:hypothetical protein